MTAGLPQAPAKENVSTTLSSGITDSSETITVADASNLQYPTYLVIDRVDSSGTLKSESLWEYVKVTNISGNDLTVTRAQGGSTAQSHSAGAIIEAVMTADHWQDMYAALNPEHTAAGLHVISTATVNTTETKRLAVTSIASIVYGEIRNLAVSSIASIARIQGVSGVFSGTISAATVIAPGILLSTGQKGATGETYLSGENSTGVTLSGAIVNTSVPVPAFVEVTSNFAYSTMGTGTTDQYSVKVDVNNNDIQSAVVIIPNTNNVRMGMTVAGLTTVAAGNVTISMQAHGVAGNNTIYFPSNANHFTWKMWSLA